MLLNNLEFALMNNPVRAALQRHVEVPQFLRLAGPMEGGRALEIGCGGGAGLELILDRCGAETVDAFDLDARMVARARRRLSRRGSRVRIWKGDATAIAAADAAYDAVFDFAILHHVPDWRAALGEIRRVLRPGGRLYAEEVLEPFITNQVVRALLRHPQEDRFSARQFCAALDAAGFTNVRSVEVGGVFAWFVATRPPAA